MFCDLKAGKNTCKICEEEGYYPTRSPYKKYVLVQGTKVPVMQLFRCGHSMCLVCYEKMCETADFSCPFCRNKGAVILETFGSPNVRRRVDTIADFLDEWKGRMHLLRFMGKHPFLLLHKQIVEEGRAIKKPPKGKSKRYPKKKRKG